MWALQNGCRIDWAHLIRYCMHKTLHANAPLPYPHLVTLFLKHFKVSFTNEPSIKVKRSFTIGAVVVASFGYKKDLDGKWVRKQDYQENSPNFFYPSVSFSCFHLRLYMYQKKQTYILLFSFSVFFK